MRLNDVRLHRVAVAVVALGLAVWFSADAPAGLALDDAYIHLAHARNLIETGELSIVPGQDSEAVTSPLWTGLLALSYALTGDEVRAVSVLALPVLVLLALGLLALLRTLRLPDWAAVSGALTGVGTGPLLWLNASGMESALFAALAVGALWATLARRPWWLGGLVALALLTRIEGLALLGPALVLVVFGRERRLAPAFLVPLVVLAAFVAWNYVRLGSPLPSTMASKRFAHGVGRTDLWTDLGLFVDWVRYVHLGLGQAAELPVVGWLLLPLGGLGAWWLARRSRGWDALWVLLVLVGYNLAYVLLLPAQGGAGRYQVLNWLIPSLLLPAGIAGLAALPPLRSRALPRVVVVLLLVGLSLTWSLRAADSWRSGFRAHVQQILDAHGRAGRFLARTNTACRPVLAYDIGAIAFHVATPDCTPRLVDLGGLVAPELLPVLRGDFAIQRLTEKEGGDVLLSLPTRLDGAPWCPPLGLRWTPEGLVDPTGTLDVTPLAGLATSGDAPYGWLVAGNAPRVAVWRLRTR